MNRIVNALSLPLLACLLATAKVDAATHTPGPSNHLSLEQAVSRVLRNSPYEAGRVSFTDLLDRERALLDFHLGLVMSKAELAKALTRLERAVGVDLQNIASPGRPAAGEEKP